MHQLVEGGAILRAAGKGEDISRIDRCVGEGRRAASGQRLPKPFPIVDERNARRSGGNKAADDLAILHRPKLIQSAKSAPVL